MVTIVLALNFMSLPDARILSRLVSKRRVGARGQAQPYINEILAVRKFSED
jgi:hypothetical protein